MIYLFTGNSDFLVKEKTLSWKQAYIDKYGKFGLSHFKDISKIENHIISQELLSSGFLGKKKLIIIENIPLSSSNSNAELKNKQEYILNLLDNIPKDNIILFSSANIDKRGKFYKKIKKIASKIEEFNIKGEQELFEIIENKYKNKIERNAINLIIKYKGGNLAKIISEIEKLLIYTDIIKFEDIKNNIFPELEESIFQLIDDIMNLHLKEALVKLNIIISQVNIYAFYNNLLANLRILVYIQKLKQEKNNNISQVLNLKNRSFLVNKNYKIKYEKLRNLYIGLINLDKKLKSGKMIGSEDFVLKYEIEKELLKLS